MIQKQLRESLLGAAVAAALLASSAVTSEAQPIINRFDSAAEISTWRTDYGSALGSLSWNGAEDNGGGAVGSGALQLDMNFDAPFGGDNKAGYTSDFFGSETDLSGFTGISIDIKVDTSSADDAFGQNGFMKFVIRNTNNYDFIQQVSGNIDKDNGWVTFSGPLVAPVDLARAFTFELYGGPSQDITGPVTVYLDNIVLTPIPEPASCGLVVSAAAVLLMFRRRR